MNFKKDVLKVIEVEVFSPTPQLPILCCVETGFQEPRLPHSLWAVFIHCICVYLLAFLVAFLLVPRTTCGCLTPLHSPTAQNLEGYDMSPVCADVSQKHVKSTASQWHSVGQDGGTHCR